MQILHQQGFMVGYQSMDIDTYAYDVTKQAFYDGRILAPAARQGAERDRHARDRPEEATRSTTRRRDRRTSPTRWPAWCFGLTMRREIWARHGISAAAHPAVDHREEDPSAPEVERQRERGRGGAAYGLSTASWSDTNQQGFEEALDELNHARSRRPVT